jgi:hypothetical protein
VRGVVKSTFSMFMRSWLRPNCILA